MDNQARRFLPPSPSLHPASRFNFPSLHPFSPSSTRFYYSSPPSITITRRRRNSDTHRFITQGTESTDEGFWEEPGDGFGSENDESDEEEEEIGEEQNERNISGSGNSRYSSAEYERLVEVGQPSAPPLMATTRGPSSTAALLDNPPELRRRRSKGEATWAQTLGNIVVSIVGTGVLGLPYAFRMAGWLAGSLTVAVAGGTIYLCMILLIQCRNRLEENDDESGDAIHIQSYGDLGAKVFGATGRYLTEFLVVLSQAGSAVAYLIFIVQNLSSFAKTNQSLISPSSFIFLLLLPLELSLSFIHSLSSIAPFSAFADACNVLAMAIVIKEDFQLFDRFSMGRSAFNGIWGLPFAGGVAVFCFEGFSMTLALEASMTNRRKFPLVLLAAFIAITIVYVSFGSFGYLAYGNETKDIITLNLPNDWSAIAVKVGICVALVFTFPITMHPIYEIVEMKLTSFGCFQKLPYNARGQRLILQVARMAVLVMVAIVASCIPSFGTFISLVGSTACAMLSFVLPATFHLVIMGSDLKLWRRAVDYIFLLVGLAFASYGTYDALKDHIMSS